MSLQKQIREDMINAMKTKDTETVSLLRVVAGEFGREMNNGIELQDDQVTAILKRMKKNAIIMGNLNEIEILNKYLPTILSETQTKTIVGGIIQKNGYSEMRNIDKVMSTLKTHPKSTQIDEELLSK